MKIQRKKTRTFLLRDVPVGGSAPVSIQSMTKIPTNDVSRILRNIKQLKKAGCDIIRVAVLTKQDAAALGKITAGSPMPVVADIHFSKELAMEALRQGVDGIRINPGNITQEKHWRTIAREIVKRDCVLRIGANSGSIAKKKKYQSLSPVDQLSASALDAVHFFEKAGVQKIKISLKSSSVLETIAAYKHISKKTSWPLHVGVTATGTGDAGIIKATIGIGSLLAEGIGDTIRVSLNDSPLREVIIARRILQALEIRPFGIEVIACPGCGRTQIDILQLAKTVEQKVKGIKKNLKIAVMGCIVNGPGEAKDADIGIAGGKKEAIIFAKGKVIGKAREKDIIEILIKHIENM